MAINASPNGGRHEAVDPVLETLAKTNIFDSDWPELQHRLNLALSSAIDLFLSSPSSSSSNATITATPQIGSSPTPPPLTLSSSPSGSGLFSPSARRFGPAGASPSAAQGERSDPPSTPGGLVIPPFPPLDPNRRRRSSASSTGSGPSIASVRVNGHPPVPVRGNVFEDEWDEDVVIGGKTLPATMQAEGAKRELQRVSALLNDYTDPPFTIQRLAELLIAPRETHSSVGKYLRAIEKLLLVTSSWERPSYQPVPVNTFAVAPSVEHDPGTGGDIESTMPPRSATPMFSPLPFSQRIENPFADSEGEEEDGGGDTQAGAGPSANGPSFGRRTQTGTSAGLMSPLTLGPGIQSAIEEDGDVRMGEGVRSPTPEPEKREQALINGHANGNGRVNGNGQTNGHEHGPGQANGNGNANANGTVEGNATYIDSPRPAGRTDVIASASNTTSTSAALASSLAGSSSGSSSTSTASASASENAHDPAHQPYLGRVDELDTGPLNENGHSQVGEHDSTQDTEGRTRGRVHDTAGGGGEGGNMTPHGMSDRPVPISSTTVLGTDPLEGREVAGLPRRVASSANLAGDARADADAAMGSDTAGAGDGVGQEETGAGGESDTM